MRKSHFLFNIYKIIYNKHEVHECLLYPLPSASTRTQANRFFVKENLEGLRERIINFSPTLL